jgi:hypothetical protein
MWRSLLSACGASFLPQSAPSLVVSHFVGKRVPAPNPAVNPDAPSAWLLSLRGRERRTSVQRRARAPVT